MKSIAPVLICALACGPSATAANATPTLAGVWASERNFGLQSSKALVTLTRRDGLWFAAIGNAKATGRRGAMEVTFSFPVENQLRIPLNSSSLYGQWVQPAHGSANDRYASPVTFAQNSANRWSGLIQPLLEQEHLYLVIAPKPDGSLQAFFRNPEHNIGAFMRMRDVAIDGGMIRLFYGFTEQRRHDERSAGKSVTTLLVGRSIEDGASLNPAMRVYPMFRQYAPIANDDVRKQAMTVGDPMTMQTGYNCDDDLPGIVLEQPVSHITINSDFEGVHPGPYLIFVDPAKISN